MPTLVVKSFTALSIGMGLIFSKATISRAYDIELDHVDVVLESEHSSDWWLQGVEDEYDEQLTYALKFKARSRGELALRLGEILDDAHISSRLRRRVESRFVDTLCRLARDTAIQIGSRKLNNAARARPKRGGYVDDLALLRLGKLQAMLGTKTPPFELISQAAMLLNCEKEINQILSNESDPELWISDPFYSHSKDNDEEFKAVVNRTALARIMTTSANAILTQRLDDDDAKQLRQRLRRRRIAAGMGTLIVAESMWWIRNLVVRAGGLKNVWQKLCDIISTIAQRRVIIPLSALLEDLLLNHRRGQIGDPRAVSQAEYTLQRMLRDFHHDVPIEDMSPKKGNAMATDLDMSAVHSVMVKEIKHAVRNILSGHVARAMLVQIQFVQLQLARSIAAIDSLLGANQALISVLALVPSIACAYLFVRGIRGTIIALISESYQTTAMVHNELAAAFSELARLIFLADQTKPLDDATLGAVTILNARLIRRLQNEHARFRPAKLARLLRGLRDLVSQPPIGQTPRTASQFAHLLNHLLWDFDFLRLDHAYGAPPP